MSQRIMMLECEIALHRIAKQRSKQCNDHFGGSRVHIPLTDKQFQPKIVDQDTTCNHKKIAKQLYPPTQQRTIKTDVFRQ